MKPRLFSLALIGALPFSAFAADTPVLEEIVITSSRLPMPMRQVGTAVSRLDEEEIRQRGHFALADILRTVPAVGVSNNGGPGKPTALRIRGEEAFRTLVLVDGMDISDPTPPQSSPRIQHLTSAGINSVEILRGPQGMMYGADAGGVVNVRTRRPEPGLQSSLRIDAGRYDTEQMFVDLGGTSGTADFYLSGNRMQTEGFNASANDAGEDRDGYENITLHARLGFSLSDNLSLQAVVRDVSSQNEYDACFESFSFSIVHNCRNDFDQRSERASLEYAGEVVSQRLALQRSRLQSQDYAAGRPYFESRGELVKTEYLGSLRMSEAVTLVYGIDHKRETMRSGIEDLSRGQLGYYLEYQGAYFDRLYLTAGLRRDDNDDFGKHTSYRVSAAYLLEVGGESRLKLKSSMGNGFRAPSLYEVAYNRSPWAMPPAAGLELAEEKSRGFDLGVEYYVADHTRLEAVWFDQRLEDEIYFDLSTYAGYLQSRGSNRSSGAELSAWHQSNEIWALSANFTYNETETANGDPRIRRPKQLANANLSLFPGRALSLRLGWRTSRNALAGDGSKLDDYSVVDVNSRLKLSEGVTLSARIENLSNEQYQEVVGFNTAGRAAYLGAALNF